MKKILVSVLHAVLGKVGDDTLTGEEKKDAAGKKLGEDIIGDVSKVAEFWDEILDVVQAGYYMVKAVGLTDRKPGLDVNIIALPGAVAGLIDAVNELITVLNKEE